ncbi:MAG: hypothetical protein RBR86_01115 [Pseudobdellovibrionaceae bacterium]|jgi:hypothetical protein|nr:hypothetical protein [Pseudobdellovibrionaceae bacterium]
MKTLNLALVSLILFSPTIVLATPDSVQEEQLEASTPTPTTTQEPESPAKAEKAQESEPKPEIQPTRILPSKIKPLQNNAGNDGLSKAAPDVQNTPSSETLSELESLTLPPLDPNYDGSKFGSDFSRQKLIEKFSKLSAKETKPEDRSAIIDFLRTSSYEEGKVPDKLDKNTQDLYTLRLMKLLEFGDFGGALSLYTENNNFPPNANAAQIGILSMMWNQSFALACLDRKAIGDQFTEQEKSMDGFWGRSAMFCDALLGPASGDDETQKFANTSRIYLTAQSIKTPETIEDLASRPPMEVITLGGAGKLTQLLTENKDNLNNLPPVTLALLARFGTQTPELSEALTKLIHKTMEVPTQDIGEESQESDDDIQSMENTTESEDAQ